MTRMFWRVLVIALEAALFLAVALLALVYTLQNDAPSKFIYYNF